MHTDITEVILIVFCLSIWGIGLSWWRLEVCRERFIPTWQAIAAAMVVSATTSGAAAVMSMAILILETIR